MERNEEWSKVNGLDVCLEWDCCCRAYRVMAMCFVTFLVWRISWTCMSAAEVEEYYFHNCGEVTMTIFG